MTKTEKKCYKGDFDLDFETMQEVFDILLHYGEIIDYSDCITTDKRGYNHFFRLYHFSYLEKEWEVIKKDGVIIELSIIV